MFDWEQNFESEFNLNNRKNDDYKLIIGLKPYFQYLNKKPLAVHPTKKSYNSIYDDFKFKSIAFLVTDWIKIQDSLEMIFNLIFGNNVISLNALAYLRQNKIDPEEFALYLLTKHRIILINRHDNNDNKYNIQRLVDHLMEIKEPEEKINILFVGKKSKTKLYLKKDNQIKLGEIIHPSGVNLNLKSNEYYEAWFKLQNKEINLSKFTL